MNELISVIVPVYNVEKYLKKCLDSIVKQTYRNLEIIIVNDGSEDNCLEIIKKYEKKDKRIKVVNKKNGGLSDARNAGVKIATGDYIMFIDSDDFLELDMCEYLLDEVKKNDADIGVCGTIMDYEDGKIKVIHNDKIEVLNSKEAIIKMNSFSSFNMAVWNKIYKKEIIAGIEFPKGKKSEDYFVMFRFFDRAKKIVVLPKEKYHYYQRKNSISRNKNINFDFIEASKEQKIYIDKQYPEISFVGNTAYAFSYITIYNIHLDEGANIDKEFKKLAKNKVKMYLIDILKNNYIKPIKKIQAIIFSISIKVYSYLFKLLNEGE